MSEIKGWQLIIIIILAFSVGSLIYKSQGKFKAFKPNVSFVIDQLKHEYTAITNKLADTTITLTDLQRLKITSRQQEIREHLNMFAGCSDSSLLDIDTMTCKVQ